MIAYASNHIATAQSFLAKINEAILYPLITLMTAVALLLFLYGAFQYVKNAGSDQGRETGRRHLVWGVIGMLVMLSAYAILTIAAGTFNLQNELDRVDVAAPGNRAPTGATAGNDGGAAANNTGGATGANGNSWDGGLNPDIFGPQ